MDNTTSIEICSSMSELSDVSKILLLMDQGDPTAADQLLPLVYDELRSIARQQMAKNSGTQTLDPTGLVHEAYLRLMHPAQDACVKNRGWQGKLHFLRAAAIAMRHILVDSARRRGSEKRGSGRRQVALTGDEAAKTEALEHWLMLDEALDRLAEDDPLAAEIAQARLFAGMTVEEASQALGVSRATAFRHWVYARARLKLQLREEETPNVDI
jgi:RNA polymerase sigma factor (TIGR02999 family)